MVIFENIDIDKAILENIDIEIHSDKAAKLHFTGTEKDGF